MANDTTVFRSLVEQIQQRDREVAGEPARAARPRREPRREEEPATVRPAAPTTAGKDAPKPGLLSRRWL